MTNKKAAALPLHPGNLRDVSPSALLIPSARDDYWGM